MAPTPSLAEYQQSMHAYLLAEEAAPARLTAWCTGDAAVSAARLATYRGTCSGTLVQALRLSYPAVRQVLGAEFFDAMAARFARLEPPGSAYLNDYGERFASFVAARPETASLVYLADLARLEWAVNRALHAPDVAPLDPARLQVLAPEALAHVCFRAHPAVGTLALRFPAERIWQVVLARDEAGMRHIELASGAGWILIERDADHAVRIQRLSDAVGRLSERLFAGVPLHVALEAAGDDAMPPEQLQTALAEHLAAGRLVEFYLHKPPGKEPAP